MFFWTAAPVAIFFLRRLLVPITASGHFLYKFFVAVVERVEFPDPAQCFWMAAVAAFLFSDDKPDRVELTVFTEKMLSA